MDITEEEIARYAGEAGFDACGVTDIGPMPEDSAYLTRWNALGYAGNMGYMNRYTGLRADPTLLLPGARCAVVTLLSYYPRERQPEDAPQIATYAYGADYHYIVKHKLRHIADRLTERLPHVEHLHAISARPHIAEEAYSRLVGRRHIGFPLRGRQRTDCVGQRFASAGFGHHDAQQPFRCPGLLPSRSAAAPKSGNNQDERKNHSICKHAVMLYLFL